MGVFISEAPGAVSFATAEPQALRRYFDNVTQYPIQGSHVEFDPLFFPNAFNVRATLELGTCQRALLALIKYSSPGAPYGLLSAACKRASSIFDEARYFMPCARNNVCFCCTQAMM